MSTDGQGNKCHRNIAENYNRLSRVHERRRQTTDGQATSCSLKMRILLKTILMTALKHVTIGHVVLAEAEWVRSGSRIRIHIWTPVHGCRRAWQSV